MLDFIRMATTWYGHIDDLPIPSLVRLFRGGALIAKLFTRAGARKGQVGFDPADSDESEAEALVRAGAEAAEREA
jgi:hypothetical protein